MKLSNICLTVIALLLSLASIAQKSNLLETSIFKRLYIGDRVPIEFVKFNNIRNYQQQNANLSDFKGKFVILDFWNIWCANCVAAFPELQKLQEEFKDDVQIILVTNNTSEQVSTLYKVSPILKSITLPIVQGDTILNNYLFPHVGVPYHVWIDREGVVKASTNGYEATPNNIRKLIENRKLSISVRNDITHDSIKEIFDERKSLMSIRNGAYVKYLQFYRQYLPIDSSGFPKINMSSTYYSCFMKNIPGLVRVPASITYLKDSTGRKTGIRYYKKPLLNLFKDAYLTPIDSGYYKIKKIIIENGVQLEYKPRTGTDKEGYWYENTSYNYENVIPNFSIRKAHFQLQKDLTDFTGIEGRIDERLIKCAILFKNSKKDLLMYAKKEDLSENSVFKMNDNILISNVPFMNVISYLKIHNADDDDPVIIDETGYSGGKRVQMILKCKNWELNVSMEKALSKYGIGVRYEVRKMKVLVLHNKQEKR